MEEEEAAVSGGTSVGIGKNEGDEVAEANSGRTRAAAGSAFLENSRLYCAFEFAT